MAQSRSPSPFPITEMRSKQPQEDELEQQALGSLPEDALAEILSRVPYSSLCRFKCVSRPWLALCSAPDIRKRSPQTLSGFFYDEMDDFCSLSGFFNKPSSSMTGFCNLSGRGPPMVNPSLPFLDKSYEHVLPKHCGGGLVLCRCQKSGQSYSDEFNFVVCNPATEKWIELPPCPIDSPFVKEYLGFDPHDPSRFVVFMVPFLGFTEVAIYSSGGWTTVQNGWINKRFFISPSDCVFLNDTMHFMTHKPSVMTVDSEGKVWREIDIPGNVSQSYAHSSIGQSQGRFYAWYILYTDYPYDSQLSVWALEDYDSAKWTLKHTVNVLELFGRHCCKDDESYEMFAIHPDHNLIFLTDGKKKTIQYDMDNREVHVICTSMNLRRAQPYIPCFADLPPDGH